MHAEIKNSTHFFPETCCLILHPWRVEESNDMIRRRMNPAFHYLPQQQLPQQQSGPHLQFSQLQLLVDIALCLR